MHKCIKAGTNHRPKPWLLVNFFQKSCKFFVDCFAFYPGYRTEDQHTDKFNIISRIVWETKTDLKGVSIFQINHQFITLYSVEVVDCAQ